MLPDTQLPTLLRILPPRARPFALLARFDRPIGWWLLYWPCAWSVLLGGDVRHDWPLLLWFLLGAVAMRGAGCVYNDIVDRDLDAQVERTRSRPLASGAVSRRAAAVWLALLCFVGLVVLVQLPAFAALVAIASLILVAAYPFMKRITWWPQAWLGLVFSWGALVGGATVAGSLTVPVVLLYAGSIAWVIGYDTIYALQDVEDDALVGVRSSARRLGNHIRRGVAIFYAGAVILWGAALHATHADPLVFAALLPVGAHFVWQVATLDPADGANALSRFRSNRFAGLLVALACLVANA